MIPSSLSKSESLPTLVLILVDIHIEPGSSTAVSLKIGAEGFFIVGTVLGIAGSVLGSYLTDANRTPKL